MRASARVVAEADGRGGTRLAVLHGESPLLPRRTGPHSGAGVTVHLVGGAAAPLRGDDLRLTVVVGPAAFLTVRSAAAQLALPGHPARPPSRMEIHAEVAAGGTLHWLPEPLIAAAGCDHDTITHVEVAAGGTVLWREDLVCGRHNENPGDVRTHTTIRYAGRTLHRHELSVGPNAPGWSGPAILGEGRAIGTLLAAPVPLPLATAGQATSHAAPSASAVPTAARPTSLGPTTALPATSLGPTTALPATSPRPTAALPATARAAMMALTGPGVLATAVGADVRQVRAALDPLCDDLVASTSPPAPVAA